MSVVVAIFDGEVPPTIGACAARDLARLGVTDVTLTDDATGSAVVLTGWAFDGRRHADAAIALIAPDLTARVLHGVADVVLRPGG